MPWDKQKSIDHLRKEAGPRYGHENCAKSVREAIEAGGLIVPMTGPSAAKDYGPRLAAAGFVALPGDPVRYQAGDVAVIDGFTKGAAEGIKKDHAAGHMAMYDGTQWISDYEQPGVKPYAG